MATRRAARSRPGAAVLGDLRKSLAAGWPAGFTLLTGEDAFHLDAAQRLLLENLVPESDAEMSLTVFEEGKMSPADLVGAARSTAMFAPRRVVLLRDIVGFPEYYELEERYKS